MTNQRLLLVLNLIGWEDRASLQDQSQSEIKQNQCNPALLSKLDWNCYKWEQTLKTPPVGTWVPIYKCRQVNISITQYSPHKRVTWIPNLLIKSLANRRSHSTTPPFTMRSRTFTFLKNRGVPFLKVTDKRLKEHFLKSGPSCMSFEERCSLKRGVPRKRGSTFTLIYMMELWECVIPF